MGAWGLRPHDRLVCRVQAWGWGCAAFGGGNPNPLLALSERYAANGWQASCHRFSWSSTAVLIVYQIADNEEFQRGSSSYTCACSAGTFCCRQRVPKAFGRIATRLLFSLYRCTSFLKKYWQGYNEKGVTSDTLRGHEASFASNLSLTLRELADASSENLCNRLLRHNAISIIYP